MSSSFLLSFVFDAGRIEFVSVQFSHPPKLLFYSGFCFGLFFLSSLRQKDPFLGAISSIFIVCLSVNLFVFKRLLPRL